MKMQPPVKRDFSQIRQTGELPQKIIVKKQTLAGRPSTIDANIETLLISALQRSLTVTKACEYADIHPRAFYRKFKEDAKFRRAMTLARNNTSLLAGERIITILQNGDDRDAGPMARWVYEKEMPEKYGNVKIDQQNNQQNNFYGITTDQLKEVFSGQSTIKNNASAELFDSIEADAGELAGEEEDITPIHTEEARSEYPDTNDLPQSSSTV